MSDESRIRKVTASPGADGQAGPGRSEDERPVNPVKPSYDQPSDYQKHVYIVDDESSVRQAIVFSLQTAGFSVRPFASGRDFLDATNALTAGCVLLDLRMPELGGLAVMDELGDKRRKFPCIAITGYGDVSTAVEAMKHGAKDFLEKPFTDLILLHALENVFSTFENDVKLDLVYSQAVNLVGSLSRRERETLQGLVDGLSNKAVAIQLGLSVRTVEMHRRNVKDRLGVKSLAEATRLAVLAGLQPL